MEFNIILFLVENSKKLDVNVIPIDNGSKVSSVECKS